MNPRIVRATVAVSVIVLLLFAGRWTSSFLAEGWWARQFSPEAAHFVGRWTLVSGLLELGGVLVACAWFIGHLLLVYRAIGSVQINRRLGNLEIQEALNLRSLAVFCIGGGLLLGLLAGRGVGDWTGTILLARSGLTYGELDPLLGRDFGFYLARLPLLERLQGLVLLLTVLALGGAVTLYALIGAIRWIDRSLAINSHARWHIGALAVLLGLVLAWGHSLEPYRLAGGSFGSVHDGLFGLRQLIAAGLTGTAIAAAVLSLWWAVRGGNLLFGSVWAILAAGLLLGHYVIPALVSPRTAASIPDDKRRHLDQLAYGMTAMRDSSLVHGDGPPAPPQPAALLTPTIVADVTAGDSSRVAALDRSSVVGERGPVPAWIVVRSRPPDVAGVLVVRDDRTLITGQVALLPGLPEPPSALTIPLGPQAVWPRGRAIVVDTIPGGVEIGSGLRRLALAWALQSTAVLGPLPSNASAFWHLDPADRIAQLAPFATWGAPRPRIYDGELIWLLDGYLPLPLFPGASRLEWRGRRIGGLHATFLAIVEAQNNRVRIFLRHGAGEIGKRWQSLSGGLVEPATAIPSDVVRSLAYPPELLEAQLRVLGQPHWGIGVLPGRSQSVGVSGAPQEASWKADTSGVAVTIPFLSSSQRLVSATVVAAVSDGWEVLRVLRIDSLLALPDPATLQGGWGRFPTFQQLRDSTEREGARLEAGPVRYWSDPSGLGAYQVQFARREGAPPALVWVSFAQGERRGAGHDLEEAWQNLLGLGAPLIGGSRHAVGLTEIRRLVARADSALRAGDFELFGRHWASIRRLVDRP